MTRRGRAQRDGPHAFTYQLCSRRLEMYREGAPEDGGDAGGLSAHDVCSLKSGSS